ncbi:MAG: thiamine diphosphokinase [Rhodobacteraceae bacterium]|nr:thiamine diphosphokinase [Paracoccaceae bacterium]
MPVDRKAQFNRITIVGAGACTSEEIRQAAAVAPTMIGADGGAARILEEGLTPALAIGDFDSIPDRTRSALARSQLLKIEEQETTDFDKCVRSCEAGLVVGVGVLSPGIDHGLAALNVLFKYRWRKIVLLKAPDVCLLCPPDIRLELPVGSRLSLFPLAPVCGSSVGLEWPIDDVELSPHGRVGTSNRVSAERVRLRFAQPGALLILSHRFLHQAVAGLVKASGWTQ